MVCLELVSSDWKAPLECYWNVEQMSLLAKALKDMLDSASGVINPIESNQTYS